jgi:Mn2+/Fe2+ NRAMP family transporter
MKQHELLMSVSYLIVAILIFVICAITLVAVWLMIRDVVRNVIHNFKPWNQWRKRNTNSKFYKLLVLLGIAISPSFVYWNEWKKADDRVYDKRIDSDTTISILVGDDIKEATDDGHN